MALDPIATCHLVRLLNGDFDCLDRLIVSHDRGPDAKLFFVLRELGRLGELPERPSVSFLDMWRIGWRPLAAGFIVATLVGACSLTLTSMLLHFFG